MKAHATRPHPSGPCIRHYSMLYSDALPTVLIAVCTRRAASPSADSRKRWVRRGSPSAYRLLTSAISPGELVLRGRPSRAVQTRVVRTRVAIPSTHVARGWQTTRQGALPQDVALLALGTFSTWHLALGTYQSSGGRQTTRQRWRSADGVLAPRGAAPVGM